MSNRFTADSHTSIKKKQTRKRKKNQIRNKIDPCFQSVPTHPNDFPGRKLIQIRLTWMCLCFRAHPSAQILPKRAATSVTSLRALPGSDVGGMTFMRLNCSPFFDQTRKAVECVCEVFVLRVCLDLMCMSSSADFYHDSCSSVFKYILYVGMFVVLPSLSLAVICLRTSSRYLPGSVISALCA